MSETRRLESVKFAQESAKQIITLSTAIVTFIFGAVSVGALTVQGRTFWFILIALVLLFMSIVTGIATLFALSGILSSQKLFAAEEPLNSAHYTRFGRFQFFAFMSAVLVISAFVLFWPKNDDIRKIEIAVPSAISCRTGNAELICKFSKAP